VSLRPLVPAIPSCILDPLLEEFLSPCCRPSAGIHWAAAATNARTRRYGDRWPSHGAINGDALALRVRLLGHGLGGDAVRRMIEVAGTDPPWDVEDATVSYRTWQPHTVVFAADAEFCRMGQARTRGGDRSPTTDLPRGAGNSPGHQRRQQHGR
jgi:hypothetical protein